MSGLEARTPVGIYLFRLAPERQGGHPVARRNNASHWGVHGRQISRQAGPMPQKFGESKGRGEVWHAVF